MISSYGCSFFVLKQLDIEFNSQEVHTHPLLYYVHAHILYNIRTFHTIERMFLYVLLGQDLTFW